LKNINLKDQIIEDLGISEKIKNQTKEIFDNTKNINIKKELITIIDRLDNQFDFIEKNKKSISEITKKNGKN